MKVQRIKIGDWRNFKNIDISVPEQAPLICLVGSNGTGKSHIFELITACAVRTGLSAGADIPRGDPFADLIRDFAVTFHFPAGIIAALDSPFADPSTYVAWDRTLTVHGTTSRLEAGGISDQVQSVDFAHAAASLIRSSESVHCLALDADRSFPKTTIQPHEFADTFNDHWTQRSWTKGRAMQTTRSMYEEWTKYFLSNEGKSANDFHKDSRTAAENGQPQPAFVDVFATYKASLRKVMPHLVFAGVETSQKTIEFDTAGRRLGFDQLSGGEREIAFLVGQIDRFGLKDGLFLIDEPELHLNPELVRTWVNYLTSTVENGQVWLATHSLEAVEAAGENSTILIERDETSRTVSRATLLGNQPVLAALAKAVGSPAFSIASGRFVYIEGKEALGERDRFERVIGRVSGTQYIEAGSCNEVINRIKSIRSLAEASGQHIRTTGIIDLDWRDRTTASSLAATGLIVLPVHQIENFFIHPPSLEKVAEALGQTDFDVTAELQRASDARSGGWIMQYALYDQRELSDVAPAAWTAAYGLDWSNIADTPESALDLIVKLSGHDADTQKILHRRLVACAKVYGRKRATDDLWKVCEGKEVAKTVAASLGLRDAAALERAVIRQWSEWAAPIELCRLRTSLAAV